MDITKEKFLRFEEVRKEGKYNMASRSALIETGLSKEDYHIIIKNYSFYKEQYGEENKISDLDEKDMDDLRHSRLNVVNIKIEKK